MNTDRIEKKILLRAPRSRVWKALTDSHEFGRWFGVKLSGPFVAGATVRGAIAPSEVGGNARGKFDGKPVELVVDRVEPETLFSMRWHPFAIDEAVDYSKEPMTLITFTLAEAEGGVLLTVTETGFDGIPLSRRATALKANEGGWAWQLGRI